MDATDSAIFDALRKNARISFRDLGAAVGLSPNAAAARVRRLEQAGVIAGYTVVPGETEHARTREFNHALEVFVDVRLGLETDFAAFAARVRVFDNVRDVVHMTGPFDALIHASFADTAALDAFLSHLKRECGAVQTQTRVALRPRD